LFDETSWKTEGNVHTDIVRTEYRNRYNQPKPFHKSLLLNSNGRMKKKEQIYDIQDLPKEVDWNKSVQKRNMETCKSIYAPRQGDEH
jgi:hypothetical protein